MCLHLIPYTLSLYFTSVRLLLIIFLQGQATGTTVPATSIETQTVDLEPSASPPQKMKSAMTELFGGLFMIMIMSQAPSLWPKWQRRRCSFSGQWTVFPWMQNHWNGGKPTSTYTLTLPCWHGVTWLCLKHLSLREFFSTAGDICHIKQICAVCRKCGHTHLSEKKKVPYKIKIVPFILLVCYYYSITLNKFFY